MALLLVTGGSGFVGRHVIRAAAADGWEVVAPPSGSLDVRRGRTVWEMITEWKPRAVVHLAYRRDDRPTIVEGSTNVAHAAAAVGSRLVHLSTDLVFGGRPAPYVEQDRPDATSDYGRWKAEAETAVAEACPNAVLVRTSLLYGTDDPGEQAALVRQGVRTGHPAFFTDEVRCPTSVDDLARAVLVLAATPKVHGPLHVAAPEALNRASFAQLFARWLRLDPGAVATTTLAAAGVNRPGVVRLDSSAAAALGIVCRPASEVLKTR